METKETVTTSQDSAITDTGANIQQETRTIDTRVAADSRSTASNIVRYITGLILVLMAFRFVLKLLGANPDSGFVSFIYGITGILTAPFDRIFSVASSETGDVVRSVFEPSILVAAIVYALVGWAIVKMLNLSRPAV